MTAYADLAPSQLEAIKEKLNQRYRGFQARNLALDMTRGKPSPEQLDLSLGMLSNEISSQYLSPSGLDCRNYGGLDGISEAKALFAEYLEVDPTEIIIGDSSSLKLMHDTIIGAMVYGMVDSPRPWGQLPKVRFLCPSPGYDRHFAVCEYLGIEMITIGMDHNGPDMETVEQLVATDDSIKGIWCVPKYSNPTGITYSDEVVQRLAGMATKAADFRIFCDNAYSVHHLNETPDQLRNFMDACKEAGNPERVILFGSTSKISFAGAGVAMMAASRKNRDFILSKMQYQTIGPDKMNQLRHCLFFRDMHGIRSHMQKHAAILKPKFDAVLQVLTAELADKGVATWSRPNGGYFVSIDLMDDCAATVVAMAAAAGVKITPAGATFPYGRDPRGRNIRIAPSFPKTVDVKTAMEVVTACIELASIDKILSARA